MRAQSHVEKPKRAFTQSTRLGVDLDRNVNSLHVADPSSDMPGEWSVSSQIIIDGIDTECLRSLTTQRMTGIDVSSVEESGFSSNELESRADHSTTEVVVAIGRVYLLSFEYWLSCFKTEETALVRESRIVAVVSKSIIGLSCVSTVRSRRVNHLVRNRVGQRQIPGGAGRDLRGRDDDTRVVRDHFSFLEVATRK